MGIEKEIWAEIKAAKRILITAHERVDGDGVGSELALRQMALEAGVEVEIVNDGEVPATYRFLPGVETVRMAAKGLEKPVDLVVALDSATRQRLRNVNDVIPENIKIINIDHHVSNTNFGDLNWVDSEASSTGEMLFAFARANDLNLSPEIATCLYTAIITDTGRFCYSNTHPKTHRSIAELIEAGARPSEISRRIYREERLNVLNLKRLATATLDFKMNGAIAWMDVSEDMHQQTETDYLDTQDFVDIPKSIKGAKVGLLFREIAGDGKIRVSLRSEGHADVNEIAMKFGGGGHMRASGCTVDGTLKDAHEKVLAEVVKAMESK